MADNMLAQIVAETRAQAAAVTGQAVSQWRAQAQDMAPTRDFVGALEAPGMSIIAEIKRKSPSKGWLAQDLNAGQAARVYQQGGASALSVLTHTGFAGSTDDLNQARQSSGLAVLRKDFIVDAVQIYETRALGADALLIIETVVGAELEKFLELSAELGMASLVETDGPASIERALAAGAAIIGINSRNLTNFSEDTDRLNDIVHVPAGVITVAESAIKSVGDIRRCAALGYMSAIVGEALSVAPAPAARIGAFMRAGKSVAYLSA